MPINNMEGLEVVRPSPLDPGDLTAELREWNYIYYANRTLSNSSSDCYLAFPPYTPLLFPNGTFANATSCFAPTNPLRTRGILALVFGSLFATTILFTLVNLRKHGKVYLPREKSFQAVGRRWQWYWMLFVAACGTISCFTGVDVDRGYVLGLPMTLQCFFLTLLNPGLNAVVWEYVRHWGSWQQRRLLDADPFAFKDGDLRSQIEFYVPIVFYLLNWLVFFATIPRSWTTVQQQRSPEQAMAIAAPAATDLRFKVGGILSALCLVIICFSMLHSKHFYKAPLWKKTMMPVIVLNLGCHTGYWVASAWRWDLNPFNLETDLGFQYSLNLLTALSILSHLNVRGYFRENDDKLLIAERAAREQEVDVQLAKDGGRAPPSWSSRSALDADKLRAERDLEMRAFSRTGGNVRTIEEDESGSWWWQGRKEERKDLDNKSSPANSETELNRVKGASLLQPEASDPELRRRTSQTRSEASSALSYSTFEAKPQVVRSMLDI